jgi:cell division protein FtsW
MKWKARNDQLLLVGITVLTLFGLMMVYSASMAVGAQKGEPSYLFARQSLFAAVGYLIMILLTLIDYHVWLKPKILAPLTIVTVVCLILVFCREPVKGSHRTLDLGFPVSFQPSEAAKLIILFCTAYFLQSHRGEVEKPGRHMVRYLAVVGLFAGLILVEPDLGQTVCILSFTAILFFVAGLDWKYIWTTALISLPALCFALWSAPYRRGRIYDYLEALMGPLNANHQIKHATLALGSGGLLGVGLREGIQKFSFLPEAQGDFIYPIIGEELGLVGTLLVIAAFLYYLYLGIRISVDAPDAGGFYLGLGITIMIVLQALINISSAVAIVPTEGLTLPFISQGGSSLVVCLAASGILLNIASEKHMKVAPAPFPVVLEIGVR